MESRIHIDKQDKKLEIIIKAFYDEKKQKMLFAWIVLFSICGIVILSQFFRDYDAGTKVFFGVYIAFWLFFEFKVIYAYRWRKYGEEKIVADNNRLLLIKTIGKRDVTQSYEMDEIGKMEFYQDASGNFVKSMNTSYWNINKYGLQFTFKNIVVPFAIDLENNDAKRILNEIKRFKK